MTTSREVKKALTAAFKGREMKFSCTTERVSCSDVIKVKWTGGACENEVWEVVKGFHTLRDESDMMTDYFLRSGVEIRLIRSMDEKDREFIENYVAPHLPGGYSLQWNTWNEYYTVSHDEHYVDYSNEVYKWLKEYSQTGAISVKIPSYKLNPAPTPVAPPEPEPTPEPDLTPSEKPFIIIHWSEGENPYGEEARFGSFADAHDAITEIYLLNRDDVAYGGYIKLKFTIYYPDGKTYGGRLDMSPREDDPTVTDNILKEHCLDHYRWLIEEGHSSEADINLWMSKYGFDDTPNVDVIGVMDELAGVMEKIKEYCDIQLDLLYNWEGLTQVNARLADLDAEFGIELLKRREAKLKEKLKAITI